MQLSLLLGAGFSVPAKYPTRTVLNKRLCKISHEEILVHTDGTAFFLDGQIDQNAHWTNKEEKHFIEEFLNFYSSEILENTKDFDYEDFFDYYHGLLHEKTDCQKFEYFANSFRSKFNTENHNVTLLSSFHDTYNQLLANCLSRKPEKCHLGKPYTKYASFLNFLDDNKDSYDKIQIHTLNHDLLFEELSESDTMVLNFSDGFDELGSPYYGKDNDYHKVRLRRFTDNYTSKFCLYKLHGSIDSYIFGKPDSSIYDTVKVPWGIDSTTLFKEVINEDGGSYHYETYNGNYYPDFLSGTTEKLLSYNKDRYYESVFRSFSENIRKSDILISIGYGLMDIGINEIIRKCFLVDPTKTMIVITPNKPLSKLFELKNVKYYGEGLGVDHIFKSRIDGLLGNK